MVNVGISRGSALGQTIEEAEISDGAVTAAKLAPDTNGSRIVIFLHEYTSIIQGTWLLVYPGSAAFNGMYFRNSSQANGDELNYDVYVPAGIYTLVATGATVGNYGIADYYLDDTEIASFDWYAGSGVLNVRKSQASISVTESKVYNFRLVMDGKNASSSAYEIQHASISLIKTGDA